MKLDHLEKTERRYLSINAWDELDKIHIKILLAFRMPTGLVMEAFSNIFLETALLSSCRFSCVIKTRVDTRFHDRIQRSSSTRFHDRNQRSSTIIFQALEVSISTLLLHSQTVHLVIDDNQQQLVAIAAIAARLFPVEFTEEPVIPIAEYICFAHNTNIWSAAASLFHGYIRPSSTDPQDETWIH